MEKELHSQVIAGPNLGGQVVQGQDLIYTACHWNWREPSTVKVQGNSMYLKSSCNWLWIAADGANLYVMRQKNCHDSPFPALIYSNPFLLKSVADWPDCLPLIRPWLHKTPNLERPAWFFLRHKRKQNLEGAQQLTSVSIFKGVSKSECEENLHNIVSPIYIITYLGGP